ncbi:uncharacterized protein [Miscanthus floridulus]|uniref:uncharacterized protein isoform X2 n=1 Tax=Miscanthus floridulus TaxID=154761 RepID=UPI00345A4BA5
MRMFGSNISAVQHNPYTVFRPKIKAISEASTSQGNHASARAPFQMESTGSHRTEAMPSDGLRRRRRPRRTEAKTIRVESLLGHRTFSLELDLTETIAKVKAMIYEQEGTHPTQQVLIFREQRLNNEDRTLADYGVQHGPSSSLLLDTRLHGGDPPEKEGTGSHCMEAMASEKLRRPSQGTKSIIVKTLCDMGTIKLEEVDLSETIEGVKDMIFEKTGLHPASQRLVFRNGVEGRKEWYTLREYGFQYGTDIHLIQDLRGGGAPPRDIKILVRKLDGEIFTLMLYSLKTSIYEVWRLIREQKGIRQTQQHLVFSGQPLDHDRTLADYNIQENSTLHLAPGPCGGNSGLHEDEDGLVKTGQAAGTYAAAVVNEEGSSHGHDQQSSGSQSQPLVLCHHEGRNEQIMEASSEITEEPPSMGVGVNDTALPDDQFIKQQKIRWSKYSVKALMFAITMFVTYLGSASTLFSTGNMVFKISIGAFFIAYATLSIMMPPKMGSALVYLSCFLLVLVSYLLLVSFNKYYGYAILPVPLPIVTALLQHKLLPGLMQHQRSNNNEGDHTVDIEVPVQAHSADEEDGQHFDRIFELSADIVNCGGLITVVFGNSMVGPVSAVGFLFFYTVALGLYLMMVTTVRTVVLTPHAWYLAILLKVLLVITLITALIHGVRLSNV